MKKFISISFLVINLLSVLVVCGQKISLFSDSMVKPRSRVIIDNDFGGDPDGLFHLVHQILSPSVEIRGIIGSHLKPGDGFDGTDKTAANACANVKELLGIMGISNRFAVYEGANEGLPDLKTPRISEAAKAIVKEAMREDTKLPLYILCGAGLTDIASAYLIEPKIAKRITLIWIGGPEYVDLAIPPPGYTSLEYNLAIDVIAGQVIFNHSDIPIWQVPRNAYRLALLSYAELLVKIKTQGKVGQYLTKRIEAIMKKTQKFNLHLGEIYIMGDSPLALLTALQSSFEADPSSSKYVLKPSPKINAAGLYEVNNSGRNIRVYNELDIRLMFEDFFSKLTLFNGK